MAKTALKMKAAGKQKFAVRGYTRCQRCGRSQAVYRKFGLCRICFREIDVDRIDRPRGMDITLVTTATTDEEGRELLRQLGFPFKEN